MPFNSVHSAFSQIISECCQHSGIEYFSMLDTDVIDGPDFQNHLRRYQSWISQEHHGQMSYLLRGMERRAQPQQLLPGVQSVLCLAFPYPAGANSQNSEGPRYARYLKDQDYHESIYERLESLLEAIQNRWCLEYGKKVEGKICVDTSAVLERSWAALSGLGWIGKNSMLIHKKLGSYFFLAEIFFTEKTGHGVKLQPSLCGHCQRCLQQCPSSAFEADGALNARKCISYWTLEERDLHTRSLDDYEKMGRWIAGCDICQEVCPFNLKRERQDTLAVEATSDPVLLSDWVELLDESTDQYRKRVEHSALNRVKPDMFSRNLAMSLANAMMECDPSKRWRFHSLQKQLNNRWQRERSGPNARFWQHCRDIFQSFIKA